MLRPVIEGSLEVKLPTINMDRWKAEQGRGREKRKIRRKKSKKKEDADAWKGRKVAKHCVFPMIWGSGGSKRHFFKQYILSSGHEHIFIHSLGFNTWLIIVFDMLKTAVPTKIAFSGLKTAPFGIFWAVKNASNSKHSKSSKRSKFDHF